MGMQPHVHSIEEVKSNISAIEHNSAGQGPGPAGKKAGPPTGIEGGSTKVRNVGHQPNVHQNQKGDDWISGNEI